jgi:type IV secretory pathway protease TraF
VQHLAAKRGYLPVGVPLVKNVGASAGDEVCERDGIVQINGVAVAVALPRDGAGRELVAWSGCRRLGDGEVFLVSTTSGASFDSRYYGPMERDAVIGEAIPLWIW